jgi:diaminopimelate decarboxylase
VADARIPAVVVDTEQDFIKLELAKPMAEAMSAQYIKLDDLAAGLAQKLRGSGYRLILEPGRSLVGNAGILLTRVLYVKRKKTEEFCGAGRGHE